MLFTLLDTQSYLLTMLNLIVIYVLKKVKLVRNSFEILMNLFCNQQQLQSIKKFKEEAA